MKSIAILIICLFLFSCSSEPEWKYSIKKEAFVSLHAELQLLEMRKVQLNESKSIIDSIRLTIFQESPISEAEYDSLYAELSAYPQLLNLVIKEVEVLLSEPKPEDGMKK